MAGVKFSKGWFLLITLFQLLFLSVSISSFSQTRQSYRNHEEIDVGGGMKVEILKCTGEGPTEECDCIYFTDKRQNGMRTKVTANRLKEEERAAELAKGIDRPTTNKTRSSAASNTANNRADKAIPESIKPRPNNSASKPTVSLEDAAKRADSIANARSQKLQESVAKATPADDSTEMDKVYIPKVTETGGTELEALVPKADPNYTTSSLEQKTSSNETLKDVAANPASPAVDLSNKRATTPASKDTVASVNSLVEQTNPANPATKPETTTKDIAVNPPSSTAPVNIAPNTSIKAFDVKKDVQANAIPPIKTDTVSPNAAKISPTLKDTSVAVDPITTIFAPEASDTAETGWVKQYDKVKHFADTSNQPTGGPLQNEGNRTDSIVKLNDDEVLKAALKNESETTGSGVMDSPAINGKGVKKKEQKAKRQTAKASKVSANQNNTLPVPGTKEVAANNKPGVAVNNANTTSAPSQASPKDTGAANQPPARTDTVSIASISSATTAGSKVVLENKTSTDNANVAGSGGSSSNTPASAKNVIGKTAEVNSKGVWEKATIVDKETEFLYKVHYKGTSSDRDEWVAVTQIRNIDSTGSAINKPNSDKPAKQLSKVNVNCSFEAPAPPVLNSDRFSERLAKRKIYDNYMAEKKANKQAKNGVTFVSIKAEEPYVNTVTISATNSLEVKLPLAPSGAMIYPVEAEFKLCEQVLGKTTSKTMNASYACFRNKLGSWTCAKIE